MESNIIWLYSYFAILLRQLQLLLGWQYQDFHFGRNKEKYES